MTKLVFSVDVDRDVAWPKKGSNVAGSKHSFEPSFECSKKGFLALLELVNEFSVPTTFFFEASTAACIGTVDASDHEVACHGWDHEDFTGKKTLSPLQPATRRSVLQRAKNALESQFGVNVHGFRAPYLHWDEPLLEMLSQNGFAYDSSVVSGQLENPPLPELFLPNWKDKNGNALSGYLWPLMEGKRTVSEYVDAVKLAVAKDAPYVVLATHSWHTHASVEKGVLSDADAQRNVDLVRQLLESMRALDGLEFAFGKDAVHAKL